MFLCDFYFAILSFLTSYYLELDRKSTGQLSTRASSRLKPEAASNSRQAI
jgi:hypothetical protein